MPRRPSARPIAAATSTVLATLIVAGSAHAAATDLATAADLRLDGAASNDFAGAAVGGGCDTDGDGREDVVVGSFQADPNGRSGAGSASVVFGDPQRGQLDLGALDGRGFEIAGAAAGDFLGFAVDCAGDVNGDGLEDVVVGAFGADSNGRSLSGSAYVVFGKRDAGMVDLADLGDAGYRIDGEVAGDRAGSAVAGAGDLDGDGLDDVIVGANAADPSGRDTAGSAYVVYGKRGTAPIDLAALGAAEGFAIDGAAAGDRAGFAVADAGDVNGDGRPDVLVGAYTAGDNGRDTSGSAYVVFAGPASANVDLAALGDRGYRVEGATAGDRLGISVDAAGDVDGDGRADLLIGADQAPNGGAGRAYVSFGKSGTASIDLAGPGGRGYAIEGAAADDLAGFSVAGAGDVDGDGVPDAIVGAYGADANGRAGSGSTYVVYGRPGGGSVALAGLEDRESEGFRIDGEAAGDRAGRSVASAGDFSGGGEPDVIIGADRASPRERAGAGTAYVQFSPASPAPPGGGDDGSGGDQRRPGSQPGAPGGGESEPGERRPCLPRALLVNSERIGPAHIGRSVRRLARRFRVARRGPRALRFCVEGGGRFLVAARGGRINFVASTAPGHRTRAAGPGRDRKSVV